MNKNLFTKKNILKMSNDILMIIIVMTSDGQQRYSAVWIISGQAKAGTFEKPETIVQQVGSMCCAR